MKKKIVFFVHAGLSKPGGVERVLSILANELYLNGLSVSIISYNIGKPFYPINNEIKLISLNHNVSSSSIINSIIFFRVILKFRKLILNNGYETVISIGTESSLIVAISLLFNKSVKKISWIHYSYFHKQKIRDWLFRHVFGYQFNKIVILNKTDANEFSKLFKNRVIHIPNPKTLNSNITSKLNNHVLLSVGRLDKVKDFHTLIKIFSIIKKTNQFDSWVLKIFGNDHGERESLLKLVSELKLEKFVYINNAILNIEEEFFKSDVYLMTSKDECFPLVLLEAQEFGLPIVSFDCPSGPRDIINHNIDGYLVKVGDINEYVQKLRLLMNNFELRRIMGEKARMNVRKFNIDNIVHRWLEIL